MPIYQSKQIVWIAFESLKNQLNIDINWELIICQEKIEPYLPYDTIKEKYIDDLVKIGLKMIVYIEPNEWIPLSKKWLDIFSYCSD